jgi:lysophospholipase L1-like esterase
VRAMIGSLLLISTIAAASPDAGAAAVAFPGQWSPAPATVKYPLSPKGCLRYEETGERTACLDFIGKDWSRLSRFAEANASLGAPAKGERRVVFFGDSITDNWSKPEHGGFFPGRRYVNRGIGGQTTGQMLGRFRADVIALAPRAVVILAGTNDLARNNGPIPPEVVESNLASMLDLARVHDIRVVLATLTPICDCKPLPDGKPAPTTQRAPATLVAFNRRITDLARRSRATLLDYHRALVDPSGAFKADLTYDGLHPNAAGYAVMAPLAEKAIAAALGR